MKRVRRGLTRDEVESLRRSLETRAASGETDIGTMIRDMRLVMRKSQAEYARTCGVAPRVLSSIESGEGNPGFRTVEKLLAPFGFRLGVVASGPEPEKAPTAPQKGAAMPVALAMVGRAGNRLSPEPMDRALAVACAVLVPENSERLFLSLVRPILARLIEATPPGGSPLITDALESADRGLRELATAARRDLFAVLLKLDVTIVYFALRVRTLPEASAAGLVERQVLEDEDAVMRGLMERLLAFGRETGHLITLAIEKPLQVTDDSPSSGRSQPRRLSLSTFRKMGAMPKGARPSGMGELRFYDKQDPRMTVADVVAQSLGEHLHGYRKGQDLTDHGATAGWDLGQLVQ